MTEPLIEGKDFNYENGLMVFTRDYLLRRGYCCQSKCRNCPYGFEKKESDQKDSLKEDKIKTSSEN